MVVIEMKKPILTQEQKNKDTKKLIRQKAIERGKLEKESKNHNRIRSQMQTQQYNYINPYLPTYEHICPNCQRKKYLKRRQQYQYTEPYPYYQYQEQYQQPYYENNENDYQDEYQYSYRENNNTYEQPKYEIRTFQPYAYSLKERNQLLKTARPMFTILSYGITTPNIYGTSVYNINTEPVQKGTKIQILKNNQNIKQQKQQPKKEIKKEVKKEENKANVNIKKDIKKTINVKEEKKVEKKIEKKEEKKGEKKEVKKEEKKVEKRGDRRIEKQPINNNQKSISKSRYNKRGGFNIVKKTEKIRQSSTNKNDKGKKHHLTYEVINIEVEKKE